MTENVLPILKNTTTVAQAQNGVDPGASSSPPVVPPDYSSQLRQHLERYRERGIAVVPLDRGDKDLHRRGWALRPHDISEFTYDSNVGIQAGALNTDLVCVDLDAAIAVEKADAYLPVTQMIEGRPSKQRSHRYYRVTTIPPALTSTCRSAKQVGGGPRTIQWHAPSGQTIVEIRGTAATVAAPPSLHPSGEQRAWDVFGEAAVVDCIELYHAVERLALACGARPRLAQFLGTAAPADSLPGGRATSPPPAGIGDATVCAGGRYYVDGLPPMDERVRRARAYLDTLDGAMSGQGGHSQTFRAACLVVRDFAIDPEDAWDLLQEYNQRCVPPWSDTELAHKIEDADRFGGERGWKLGGAEESDDAGRQQQGSAQTGASSSGIAGTGTAGGNNNASAGAASGAQCEFRESPTDPQRLARGFLRRDATSEGLPRWRYWQQDFWHWDGYRYVRLADEEFKARLARALREDLEALAHAAYQRGHAAYQQQIAGWSPQAGTAAPTPPAPASVIPVTTQLVSNTRLALTGLTLVPFATEQPAWLLDGDRTERRPYLALQNGIIDIVSYIVQRTTTLLPHSPRWFSSVCLPYDWDPAARCPRWTNVLDLAFAGDAERIALMQEWFGYCLVPNTDEQRFLMMYGEGNNGKSVICAALRAMLGAANVSCVPLEAFGERFASMPTVGKLANVVAEIGELDKTAEGRLKAYTSGDPVTIDRKGRDPIVAIPTARLTFATNTLPRFTDRTEGLWRRLLLVPCDVVVPAKHRVRGMDKSAWWERSGELSGMLLWALAGLRRVQQRGFTEPAACCAALGQYRLDSSPARAFLSDFCERRPGDAVSCAQLYSRYAEWCAARGYRQPLADSQFGKEVKRVFKAERKYRGSRLERGWVYLDLGMRADAPTAQDRGDRWTSSRN